MKFESPTNSCRRSAYTLIEVLAALLLLAIVIPVALEALDTASLAGDVAARKGEAARIAEDELNQSVITTNWNFGTQTGTMNDGGRAFNWTVSSESWPQDSVMELLTAQVRFSVQGRNYSVQLSTLAESQTLNPTTASMQ
ncbi:MAG TPA: prepilin-type N-terminal cleavage/methylation domain-containing protein [Candidatus Sulfopaludibacter sp.]|nr:prepilin-type N-terminal cleavage/methylation domain-containing protein [Candidatus Sulfopaludibacter sp.]